MSSLASISGLATGIDFRSLVDQIASIESKRLDHLRARIARNQATQKAWGEVRGLLARLSDAVAVLKNGAALDTFVTQLQGPNTSVVSVSAGPGAAPGRHKVRVLRAARRETVASASFSSKSQALGLAGSFAVGGKRVSLDGTESLDELARRINAMSAGARASVVGSPGSYRLVLAAEETGAAGLRLVDFSGVLATIGFTDGTSSIQHRTSGGFLSDPFESANAALGTWLGFSHGAPAGTVTLGEGTNAFTVFLDLGSLTLAGVRDAINSAAAAAGAATFAELVTESSASGPTMYRLKVTGEAVVTDDGGVLRALGVVAGRRDPVKQVVAGGAMRVDAQGTPATADSLISDLYNGTRWAGAAAGDTIRFEGTRHDGTTFSFVHAIQTGDTVGTLLSRLQSDEGFGTSAAVYVDGSGRIAVASAVGGTSRLALRAWAGNESGGILDLGSFAVIEAGRERVVSVGTNALVEIDGILVENVSNRISGVLPGVDFTVHGADASGAVDVLISRDIDAGVKAVRAFVEAYNAYAEFVRRGVGDTDSTRPPLARDMALRGLGDRISSVLQASNFGLVGSLNRLGEIGLERTRMGTYRLDETTLSNALRHDVEGVRALLGGVGATTTASLTYLGAGTATQPGTYDVVITQLGARAAVQTAGFGGVYLDDGVPDTLSIQDLASGATYGIPLAAGMTSAAIVAAINAELRRAEHRELESERTLYADAAASAVATGATPLGALHHGAGQSSGFVSGTTITISGTRPDGTNVFGTFAVADANTQTLGMLRAAVQAVFGGTVSVTIRDGRLVARALQSGRSSLAVNIGADVSTNPTPVGQMLVRVVGRDAAPIVAEEVGSELRIRHEQAGSARGFTIEMIPGGSSGAGSLGLMEGTYRGTDIAGTVGGHAATGVGDVLTGDSTTPVEGLMLRFTGSSLGTVGSVAYAPGFMGAASALLADFLRTGSGVLDGALRRLDEATDRARARLTDREARLEVRREALLARFVALEEAMAKAQSLQQWMTAQLNQLPRRNT